MPEQLTQRQKGFTAGFVYACAQCIRLGNEFLAELLWRESNFSPSDLDECDDYDADEIRAYLDEWDHTRR